MIVCLYVSLQHTVNLSMVKPSLAHRLLEIESSATVTLMDEREKIYECLSFV